MENTIFLLLRHGQTISNRTGFFQGWHDSPLDENGEAQAAAAAAYLKDIPFDFVFSSDLGRARQTIQAAMAFHPEMEVIYTESLREWHLGDYDGKYQPDIKREHPEVIRAFILENELAQMPNGESRQEFQERINAFFRKTALAHPGKTILICTHGGVFQRVFRMVSGDFSSSNRLPLPQNASLSKIQYLPDIDGWQLLEWNIHHYLGQLPAVRSLAL